MMNIRESQSLRVEMNHSFQSYEVLTATCFRRLLRLNTLSTKIPTTWYIIIFDDLKFIFLQEKKKSNFIFDLTLLIRESDFL